MQQLAPVTVTLGWYLYFCMRGNAITSIAVDLTFGSDPAAAELPWLTIVKIDLHEPFLGVAVDDEAVLLDEMSERFEAELDALGRGLLDRLRKRPAPRFRYVARETRDGARYLYFHGTAPVPKRVYQRVFAVPKFATYDCGSLERHEPDHATWREELHPGPALNPLVLSRAQVEMRLEQGDRLEIEREVEHRIEFDSSDDRRGFIDYLEREDSGQTFRIAVGDESGVTLTATHRVDGLWTDIHVSALVSHAAKFGGRYDGWGALVIADPRA